MTITIPPELMTQLRQAKKVAMLTGAGVSKESGVPTFRDALEGLWADYDPQELATPQAFRRNPKLVWDWYAWRRNEIHKVEPNPGHVAIAQMEQVWEEFTLITQNVDSLHHRAGSTDVIELHGNITRVKCMDNDHVVDSWEEAAEVPTCAQCGSLLRPDVVWFGEMLPAIPIHRAIQKAEASQIFFSVGTSSLVEPAASLPLRAKRRGATIVEVNPAYTMITADVHYVLQGPSGEVLPALLEQLQK